MGETSLAAEQLYDTHADPLERIDRRCATMVRTIIAVRPSNCDVAVAVRRARAYLLERVDQKCATVLWL